MDYEELPYNKMIDKEGTVHHGKFYSDRDSEKIPVSESLRIKVNTEREARFVVEYAEGDGFTSNVRKAGYLDFKEPYVVYELVNFKGEPKKGIDCMVADDNYHITFSDYDQWTAWVDYWADKNKNEPCPNCDGTGLKGQQGNETCDWCDGSGIEKD
jgi:hypothetical protein